MECLECKRSKSLTFKEYLSLALQPSKTNQNIPCVTVKVYSNLRKRSTLGLRFKHLLLSREPHFPSHILKPEQCDTRLPFVFPNFMPTSHHITLKNESHTPQRLTQDSLYGIFFLLLIVQNKSNTSLTNRLNATRRTRDTLPCGKSLRHSVLRLIFNRGPQLPQEARSVFI